MVMTMWRTFSKLGRSRDSPTEVDYNINGDPEVGERSNGDPRSTLLTKSQSSSRKSKRSSDSDAITEKLHNAVWPKNDLELLTVILEQYPEELNKPHGVLKDTLLHRAVRHGKTGTVSLLLLKNVKIDSKNIHGQTPLHVACQSQKVEIVKLLVNAGADVNLGDLSGDAPIHLACKGGSMEVLEIVMEKSLCKMGCEGHLGNSLLHYASQYGHIEMMTYLLDNDNDPNVRNFLSETPLHLAAGAHLKSIGHDHVKLLLDRGADLNARTDWGDTAAHFAALSGTREVLEFLCNRGISLSKPTKLDVPQKLAEEYGLSQETCDEMSMSLLQKVARSTCIKKATFVLENMMKARTIVAYNHSASYLKESTNNFYNFFRHTELSEQQIEYKAMAHELHTTMNKPNSALRLFLKYTPDSLDHLFNLCLVSFCGDDQVQGKVSFDFFLFYPPDSEDPNEPLGELNLIEILIKARKERFLTHPIFEAFLKLKWYRTWSLYMLILILFSTFVTSLVCYTLFHFGNVLEQQLDPYEANFWWYFLVVTTSYVGLVEFVKISYFVKTLVKQFHAHLTFAKLEPVRVTQILLSKLKDLSIPVLCILVLSPYLSVETRRYTGAVAVIFSCFSLMSALSRLPKIGIYIFMLNKVFITIMNFFVSYFWHFLGYAIAFHLIMPVDGPFSSLGNSVIKVLTMLMGEYDFTDNFANNETFWLSKIIFVFFVIDMSVVLMNLVLGLAVNDVESILQDSKVRRMVHETLTVSYLESLCLNFSKLPFFRNAFKHMRITNSDLCQFKEVVYLNLLDIVHNESNEIIVDRSMVGGKKKSYPSPESVTQGIVAILKGRLRFHGHSMDAKKVSDDLREQNLTLISRIEHLESQMDKLVSMMQDMHKQTMSK